MKWIQEMKIHLIGADNFGWALDTDFGLAMQALSSFAEISRSASKSDYIHSVSPNTTYKRFEHHGNRFISVFQGAPKRLFKSDNGFYQFCKNKLCVAQSKQAYKELEGYGIENIKYVPYIADLNNYYYISNKEYIFKKYNIEKDKFIICNFMRDSQGYDLTQPKLVKGPDIFVEIVQKICEVIGNDKILVLLAGPRRHWIKNELVKKGINYKYIGKEVSEDDIDINILPANVINELMNVSNLMIIPSRSEGAPRGILEACAARTPILSMDVGIAGDTLNKDVIFKDPDTAADLAVRHFETQYLNQYIDNNYYNVCSHHSVQYVGSLWKELYCEYIPEKMLLQTKRFHISDYDFIYNIKKRFIH